MSVITAEQSQIQKLWSWNQNYKVPPFQRSYSWWWSNVQEFLDDIEETNQQKETHFIWSMIFSTGEDSKYLSVLDWQQRFSTILIILASLRDVLFAISERDMLLKEICEHKISLIEKNALFSENSITWEKSPKLRLNKRDHYYFSEILQKKSSNILEKKWKKWSRKSHKLIYEVYSHCFTYFESKYSKITEPNKLKEEIESFMECLYTRLIFIEIRVWDMLDANKVFESINHKWVRLSGADLIKNYIFSEIQETSDDDVLNDLIEEWDTLSDSWIDVVRFIRHYWLSNFVDKLSKDDIFPKVKEYVKETWNISKLLQDLFAAAKVYRNCDIPTDEFWSECPETKNNLIQLWVLGTEQSLILLLAAYDRFYQNNEFDSFNEILSLLENFIFRRNTICHKDAKELEKLYADLAKKLRKNEIWVSDIKQELILRMPNNDEFGTIFRTYETQNSEIAKYILTKIYQPEIRDLLINQNELHWEHIIPKKYINDTDYWEKIENELKSSENELLLKDMVDRLWNFTLLLPTDNIKVSNYWFPIKKEKAYFLSNIPENKRLCDLDNFWISDVIARQDTFSKKAIEIWKL